ncbi:MAG: hypothetical protein ALECFALPRED_000748 [Alectoria fallacina]|uniref:CENP-V/GFA domain-containing protein n=1 Tax=Alectoria fallacina TaxID=1903189 RepID=A0A8H3JA32_9LECA|nr:MAG: hypothetical protein ALECFALPRED_000748 [Alectoria fallacina]
MAEPILETYHGNCHCGAFKFSVKLPELKQKGYLWVFPSSFVVEKGEGTLKDYLFSNKTTTHKFCPICGTSVMGQIHNEAQTIGINVRRALFINHESEFGFDTDGQVRTLRDFDEDKLEITHSNGASVEPHYVPPNTSDVSDSTESAKCYRGSCHCGKITYDVQSKPLEEVGVLKCNCSICSRNAALWIYPSEKDVELRGEDHLTVYRFARKASGHAFCSTCGVSVVNNFEHPEGKVIAFMDGKLPVNARTINGIDLKAIKVNKANGKALAPLYEM